MKRIFKYPLTVEPRQLLQIHKDAEILSVQVQMSEFPVLYALVESGTTELETRIIRGVTTGEEFNGDGCWYVGTVILKNWFVWHVWEQFGKEPDPISDRFKDDRKQINDELEENNV